MAALTVLAASVNAHARSDQEWSRILNERIAAGAAACQARHGGDSARSYAELAKCSNDAMTLALQDVPLSDPKPVLGYEKKMSDIASRVDAQALSVSDARIEVVVAARELSRELSRQLKDHGENYSVPPYAAPMTSRLPGAPGAD